MDLEFPGDNLGTLHIGMVNMMFNVSVHWINRFSRLESNERKVLSSILEDEGRDQATIGTVPVPYTCNLPSLYSGRDTHRWVQRVLGVMLRLPFVVSHREASECRRAFKSIWVSGEFCPRPETQHRLNPCLPSLF